MNCEMPPRIKIPHEPTVLTVLNSVFSSNSTSASFPSSSVPLTKKDFDNIYKLVIHEKKKFQRLLAEIRAELISDHAEQIAFNAEMHAKFDKALHLPNKSEEWLGFPLLCAVLETSFKSLMHTYITSLSTVPNGIFELISICPNDEILIATSLSKNHWISAVEFIQMSPLLSEEIHDLNPDMVLARDFFVMHMSRMHYLALALFGLLLPPEVDY